MSLYETGRCFVCDKETMNGVCLSIGRTCFTKTALPTKLSQLIGDTFMVVVSEEDKLCLRCTDLINKSDKLELDLTAIKHTILEYLNVKYDLETSEESHYFDSEELKKTQTDFEDSNLIVHPDVGEPSTNDSFSEDPNKKCLKHDKLQETDFCKDVRIKSEPVQGSQCCDNQKYVKIEEKKSNDLLSDICIKKLSEDDTAPQLEGSNEKSTLNKFVQSVSPLCPNNSKNRSANKIPENDKSDIVLKQLHENDSELECNKTNTKSPFSCSVTSQEMISSQDCKSIAIKEESLQTVEYTSTKSMPNVNKTENANSSQTKTAVLLSNSTFEDERIDKHVSERPTKSIQKTKVSCRNTKRGPNESLLQEKRKVKFYRKRFQKDHNYLRPKKLRPILPKISNLNYLSIFGGLSLTNCIEISIKNPSINNCAQETTTVNKIKMLKNPTINTPLPKEKQDICSRKNKLHKNLICKCCNKTFETIEILRNHQRDHPKQRREFKCSFCDKTYVSKTALKNHESKHTGKYAFCCDFCGQGFNFKQAFEEHRRCHTKEDHYVCDICGKKFSVHSTYWIHRKWHDNPYPYKCNECGRLFKHTSLLAVHKRKHSGERPYKCSHCSLTFNVSNSLKRHLVLHTKEFPYTCDSCNQGFTTRFKYTEHLAKIHNTILEKPVTEAKDYKMVVPGGAVDSVQSKQSLLEKPGLPETFICEKEHSLPSFPDDLSEHIVEIVLAPSPILSDHSLTFSDSWLI